MVALAIFTFLGMWNHLFWLLIVLSEREVLTLPVGLVIIQKEVTFNVVSPLLRHLLPRRPFSSSMPNFSARSLQVVQRRAWLDSSYLIRGMTP